ncbi:malate:quinone oxidoreductase [Pedobacter antarcticus]|uniref:Probable malate:quinone oxidoreductase n=2 Tax=Pedobacter antarcticus TaxID=34086 RepID=A0A081PLY2_9SPHI|nr:malate:quinone oxidoreductase [Pedobacter antarcticus]KEQ31705.1 malate:quinone oxidoreductase [Pedobacter antarcticus 4BY]SDL50702.1 malate dehydrogenase (quinone) [Pedobacter antarcticus]SFE34621.1 malate dehydrogenase (quinone) [Pedobacter antarcticus]
MTSKSSNSDKEAVDVVLIGAGIMSATLGVLLKELSPDLKIGIYERLGVAAAESSDAWNNAGTGHSAFCELNYTPQLPDGSVSTDKAIAIAESFEVSKQFWSFLVQNKMVDSPDNFIKSIPHVSFVWGENNVDFLRKRYENLQQCELFKEMTYSEDPALLKEWMPLVMENRDPADKVAATRMTLGTDVNFGALTRMMFSKLQLKSNVSMEFNQEVRKLKKKNGLWEIKVKNELTGKKKVIEAKFVFIGAGGGSLPLLEKSDIPEGKGFGGFPVSGQWLKCTNPEVIEKHNAKVYGKASVGAPPMSVPHLDTRMIDGKKALLFGPYAGFSTRFLKNGSLMDLPLSIKLNNIRPMIAAGLDNLPLTKYLIDQVRQTPEDRLAALKEYLPSAEMKDWELETAGQRVQVIKKDAEHGGILEFGTEVVAAGDGSIAALLGASPGASTAVSIMVTLLEKCFKEEMNTKEWQNKLKHMIPSYGQALSKNPELSKKIRLQTSETLNLSVTQ